jgi:hypothetical protein
MKNFDFTKVGISALTRSLKQAAVATDAWVFISFVVPLAITK